jgi:hypothetical protein
MSLSSIKKEIKKIKAEKVSVIDSLIELNQSNIELFKIFSLCSGTKEKISNLEKRNAELEIEKQMLISEV